MSSNDNLSKLVQRVNLASPSPHAGAYRHQGSRWSAALDELLRVADASDLYTSDELADGFGRTYGSIKCRLKALRKASSGAMQPTLHEFFATPSSRASPDAAAAGSVEPVAAAALPSPSTESAEESVVTAVDLTGAVIAGAKGTQPQPDSGHDLPPLSDEQAAALDLVVTKRSSVFITGGAGTGKSILLRHIIQRLGRSCVDVTATTGMAAHLIGGETIHRFSGINRLQDDEEPHSVFVRLPPLKRSALVHSKCLVIDEVSMMDARFFSALEDITRRARGQQDSKCKDLPFGGLQLVLCGDMLQLPPVPAKEGKYKGVVKFCFESPAWEQLAPRVVMLRQVHRQAEHSKLLGWLSQIRMGSVPDEALAVLNDAARVAADDSFVALRPTNREADLYNHALFNAIASAPRRFTGKAWQRKQTGKFPEFPAPDELFLKVGARVMLRKNLATTAGLVNGRCGYVVGFVPVDDALLDSADDVGVKCLKSQKCESVPVVRFDCAAEKGQPLYKILPTVFENTDAHGELTETLVQIPLCQAWAFSIHKSQGMSLDKLNVDSAKTFAEGQAYVALSRARTLEGLAVTGLMRIHVMANPLVKAFYDEQEELAARPVEDDAPTVSRSCNVQPPPSSPTRTPFVPKAQNVRTPFVPKAQNIKRPTDSPKRTPFVPKAKPPPADHVAECCFAVTVGRQRGLYATMSEVSAQIDGVPDACYQHFPTQAAAMQHMRESVALQAVGRSSRAASTSSTAAATVVDDAAAQQTPQPAAAKRRLIPRPKVGPKPSAKQITQPTLAVGCCDVEFDDDEDDEDVTEPSSCETDSDNELQERTNESNFRIHGHYDSSGARVVHLPSAWSAVYAKN
jgi:ATP-dependent DNA helicase PIF1